jgi:hypothetical protein
MPVNTYITANGRIRRRITTDEEKVTEQVAVVTNALGSVVATYKDGWLTADRSYDPYGETRAECNDVGRFGWVGGLGYRETRREWVSHYVRARYYGYPMGMWTSVDPLWPSEPAFGYVGGMATAVDDYYGTSAQGCTGRARSSCMAKCGTAGIGKCTMRRGQSARYLHCSCKPTPKPSKNDIKKEIKQLAGKANALRWVCMAPCAGFFADCARSVYVDTGDVGRDVRTAVCLCYESYKEAGQSGNAIQNFAFDVSCGTLMKALQAVCEGKITLGGFEIPLRAPRGVSKK